MEVKGIKNNYQGVLKANSIPDDLLLALNFLDAAKNSVRKYAIALTETITPEARLSLKMLHLLGFEAFS